MTRLWWIRHGPTHAKGMIGWTDLPADLSDTARIARLSAYLPDAPVVSSDLSRARDTADALRGDRPRLDADPALREMHFGDWEGQRADRMPPEQAAALRAFHESPGTVPAPGGESWNALSARVSDAADRLARTHRGGDVIVVAHMGVILTQVQRALRLSAYETLAIRIAPLSVTRLTLDGGWRASEINHEP
ncbi:histidine phosphatase family protein [Psychromarinibacter halotolerans]|uniref:Histidine phosphatase family protein n=1 Tax=Psychromarinibacter halotolerans TaxID=1775175 RepID=A0ABV7GP41_9RHOB|nr:histidine phosphatase family protein [Psychromarinibacter halotolerans]MDF0595499.1 histidine phosphatase family protein [Psychromarinibacter halotolerans]